MKRLLLAALLTVLGGAAHAACPVIPFTFADGNPMRPSQVNDNFSTLRNCISQAVPINSVTNTAAVRALAAGVYSFVQRSYNSSPGDGSSIYYWDGSSTCTDDGQTCIEPASAPATGRWVISGTVSGNLYLNPGGDTSYTFDSAAQVSREKFAATTTGAAGSTPTDQSNAVLSWYRATGDMTGGGVNHGLGMVEFDYNDTGTTVNDDSFFGMASNCNLLGIRPNAGIPGGTLAAACLGGSIGARGYVHQGGNLGASEPQGEVHGLNVVSGVSNTMGSTPSDYVDHEGIEVDMVGCSGCTVKYRLGYYVADFGDGSGGPSTQGSTVDAAVAIGSVGGSAGWLYGIDFVGSPLTAGNALSNTGTVLGSSAASATNATEGIDLSNFVISDKSFRGPSDNFYVTGAGNMLAQAITANNGLIVDTAAGVSAITDYRSAGATRWAAGREATTLDYTIKDTSSGATVMRVTSAADAFFVGATNPLGVDSAGSVTMQGVSTSVGSITGALCFDDGTKTVIYKVGANCI